MFTTEENEFLDKFFKIIGSSKWRCQFGCLRTGFCDCPIVDYVSKETGRRFSSEFALHAGGFVGMEVGLRMELIRAADNRMLDTERERFLRERMIKCLLMKSGTLVGS